MGKPTHHSALERAGFSLVGEHGGPFAEGKGQTTTFHYTKTRGAINGPMTHHVLVHEYAKSPGRYSVAYHVTQGNNRPVLDGDLDWYSVHKSHMNRGGAEDPISMIMDHHGAVSHILDKEPVPALSPVSEENVHSLTMDRPHHWTGNGVDSPAYLRRGPDQDRTGLVSLNKSSAFLRQCPECHSTDVDIVQDYDKDENGLHSIPSSYYSGQCNNCYSEFEPKVIPSPDSASWSPHTGSLVKRADEFDDIIQGNKYAGNCSNCGKAVRDIPESSFRDDKLYQLTPEDDAPDPNMHGSPVNVCGECYVDGDLHEKAHRMPKLLGWHHPGAKPGSCPDCDRSIMEEADEDLHE